MSKPKSLRGKKKKHDLFFPLHRTRVKVHNPRGYPWRLFPHHPPDHSHLCPVLLLNTSGIYKTNGNLSALSSFTQESENGLWHKFGIKSQIVRVRGILHFTVMYTLRLFTSTVAREWKYCIVLDYCTPLPNSDLSDLTSVA